MSAPGVALVRYQPQQDRRAPGPAELEARETVVRAVAKLIADGYTVKGACAEIGIPSQSYRNWVADDVRLWEHHARARIEQTHSLADEALEVARSRSLSMTEAQDKRTHIDTIKWRCAKLHPRTYGDSRQLEITGADGGPVQLIVQAWSVSGKRVTF